MRTVHIKRSAAKGSFSAAELVSHRDRGRNQTRSVRSDPVGIWPDTRVAPFASGDGKEEIGCFIVGIVLRKDRGRVAVEAHEELRDRGEASLRIFVDRRCETCKHGEIETSLEELWRLELSRREDTYTRDRVQRRA